MFTNIKIYVLLRILDELLESEKQLEVMRNVTKLNNLTNNIFFLVKFVIISRFLYYLKETFILKYKDLIIDHLKFIQKKKTKQK